MFRSKPIGWITAGTLFCVAGVALACRLRDDKETTAEVNAAACPAAWRYFSFAAASAAFSAASDLCFLASFARSSRLLSA